MSKSIRKNYIYNMLYQVVVLLTPFITTPYLSRVLGAEGIGILSYTQSVVSYFTMFAVMGVTLYAAREISYVQDSPEKRSRLFWEVVIFQLSNTIICSLLYLFFVSLQDSYQAIYYVWIGSIINVAADITWFFTGLEDFGKIVGRNLVMRVLNIIYIFVFVQTSDDLILYAIGIVVLTLLGSISLWSYLPQYLVRISWRSVTPWKNILVIWSLFVPTIAIQIYTVLDKTMLGFFTETAVENGYYEQAMKVARIGLMVVTSLGTVMVPRIGACFAKREMEQVRYYMYRGYQFVWCLGILVCFGLIGVADNFVPWFFGDGFLPVADLLKVSALLVLAVGINNVTGVQYLIPTRRQNIFTFTVVAGAGINLILNLILIPKFYALGAVVASVAAETGIAILQFIIVRRELSYKKAIYSSKNYFLAGILMLLVLFFEKDILPQSPLGTMEIIGSGTLAYALVLLVLRDKFFLENIGKIGQLLKSKMKKDK